jgi:enoyl-CoA hydratase
MFQGCYDRSPALRFLNRRDAGNSASDETIAGISEPLKEIENARELEMSEQAVVTRIEDGLMIITINRPEAKNAINAAVAQGLADSLIKLDADPDIRVGILTGAQNTFCAGMDLKAFVRGESAVIEGRGFGGIAEAPPRKPLIAAVEGYALAGGFELALACDLVIAGQTAKFGIPEVTRGLAAGGGGLLRLPRQMPYRVAMELALTGAIVPAERLLSLGLINRIVPDGASLSEAIVMARVILQNGPLGVEFSKTIIRESGDWESGEMFRRQQAMMDVIAKSEDAREGATAFAEKRKPVWRGR